MFVLIFNLVIGLEKSPQYSKSCKINSVSLKDMVKSLSMFHKNQNSLKNTIMIMAAHISFDSL